jgi:uncharacterized protein YecE (DUF72 family)
MPKVPSKRTERRKEERRISALRAMKMHEARLAYGDVEIQDDLPKKYYVGCSGWFYWEWRRSFYASKAKTNDWFDYYSSKFDTVELNAPFYTWPTIGNVRKWLLQAEDKDFVYSIKVNELITHTKRFKAAKRIVKDFNLIGDILDGHMGCFLYQLPPNYKYTKLRLQNIIEQLDLRRRNVVEFRHESWWNEKVYSAFKEHGITFCSCSAPNLPDDIIKTSGNIYLRLHGISKWYRYDYSKAELKEWAKRIKEAKAKHAWIYFNNSFNAFSAKNALTLKSLLEK